MHNDCRYQFDDSERTLSSQEIPSLIIQVSFERSLS